MATSVEINLQDHAEAAAREFALLRPTYDSLATEIHRVLSDYFQQSDGKLKVHKVEFRAKSIESFKAKCKKPISDASAARPIFAGSRDR